MATEISPEEQPDRMIYYAAVATYALSMKAHHMVWS